MFDGTAPAVESPLSPREAYRLWVSDYERETVVSALENRIVRRIAPDPAGRRLLDVGCGTGRRLRECVGVPALILGVDLVPEMLRAGKTRGSSIHYSAADLRKLPVRDGAFDLTWCRLAIGHVRDLHAAYEELARATAAGGVLVVSDFHSEAVAAGHRRTFRDAAGGIREVEHHPHTPAAHLTAAESAGWASFAMAEAAAGEPEKPFYESAGRARQFERERDLPLVMVFCLRR